ncbi:MAG TPA: hydantoinase/carbamoylase family amidase [Baekduia sp.]|uniref:hydantoinase/carbamoylase family amidase n=1 Tax=Baekduia sp. TaxID=2600305 RepID=UPI002BF71FD7|nr:hydantoinase/carbamoylase family amidase [Baekduia sp.]HMJ33494.1 hydantoinase/carbamoylase family amidase [Baekduia sp.]
MTLVIDAERVLANLRELAELTGGPAGARRLAWSPDWLVAREWLTGKLADLGGQGVVVDRDEAGNLWAALPGSGEGDGFVIVGSHIDAVPSGGWLDGALGVTTALEVLRTLAAAGAPPPVEVRLVDWADEEGARFGRSLVGSSAVAGTLDPDDVRDLLDAGGTRLQDAMAECGIDLDAASAATARLDGARAYLELHIEQGPVLLDGGRPASAVSGTVGDERYLIQFSGQSAHAGSTPMRLRRDTLAAAATAALEIREVGIRHEGVTTVGSIRSEPAVITAIAGESEMMLDLRHLDADTLATMLAECLAACEAAAQQLHCTVAFRRVFGATPTPFHPRLVQLARAAVAGAGGGDGPPIPSGPLHDATEIGRMVPTVMLFAQSDPPISHTEVEDSPEDALRIAIEAYGATVGETIAMVAAGELEEVAR